MLKDLHLNERMLAETLLLLTVYLCPFYPQGIDFHPKYTGENLTCTVQGLKRSTQYKFRVSGVTTCLCVFYYCYLGFFFNQKDDL